MRKTDTHTPVQIRLLRADWQAVASLVIMGGTEASIPKWIVEAVRQRLEREYPEQPKKEATP